MLELDPTRFKFPPYAHQLRAVKTLLKKNVYALFWEMRLGKTKAIIDTACTLYANDAIEVCIIVCPAQVKDVWLDCQLGEIKKHGFGPYQAFDFAKWPSHLNLRRRLEQHEAGEKTLGFIVTSFEFLRQEDAQGNFPNVEDLVSRMGVKRYWLVVDEASACANHKALQTKAVYKLRQKADRVTELDGTPIGNSPLNLFAKFMILSKEILGYKSYWEFERAHALHRKTVLKGRKPFNKVIGYQNLEYLTDRTKDYCEYLQQRDVFDMPPKVPGILTAQLSPATWAIYKQLRDELIAELGAERLVLTNTAAKLTRLAQVCTGFLGGFTDDQGPLGELRELGDDATKMLLGWLETRLEEQPNFRCIVWCRFTPELERLTMRLRAIKGLTVMRYDGAVKQPNVLHRDVKTSGPIICVAQPQAAQFGLDFSRADTEVWLSGTYNRVVREQASARFEAPDGRTRLSLDVLVTGPQGQRTLTHDIVQSVREKTDLAVRVSSDWKKVLEAE